MAFHRATHAFIDLDAFRNNIRRVRSLLGPQVQMMAVVKADAYGHGAAPCARAALTEGVDCLGVGILEEGIELRECGIRAPIVVLGGIFPDEVADLVDHDLSTSLFRIATAHLISQYALRKGKSVGVHIKIDTGMGRLGVPLEDALCLFENVLNLKNLNIEGVYTHFSCADVEDPEFTHVQLSRFNEALEELKQEGWLPPLIHAANTAGLLRFPESRFNMVRPGLILYGALPSPNLRPTVEKIFSGREKPALLPVMHWKSKILQIGCLHKGVPLSYGNRYVTERDSRIATLPIGYADGLHRGLSNKMKVLVRGKRVPQVGSICMDMCLIDVTDIPGVELDDEVVIFGRQGGESISVEDIAQWGDTVPYEILCAVGKRVPRKYPA